MFIGDVRRVPENDRTLREFVVDALTLSSYPVSEIAIDALCEEIWAAPQNAALQATPRAGGPHSGDLEVAPDEWIYLPFAPPQGFQVRRLDLAASDTKEGICADVQKRFDEPEWAFPGGALTPADLEANLFNAGLRNGDELTEIYFYVVPKSRATTEVAPITAASTATSSAIARASPDWLLPLWHWIDRLHRKAAEHAAVLQDLFDLCGEGKMMAMAMATVDGFLTVVERECKTPKPTSLADRIGQVFAPPSTFDIADFHAKVKALRNAAQSGFVDHCVFPMMGPFRTLCDELAALEANSDFLDRYKKFDKVRERYPATEHALQTVLASYALCRGYSPGADDFVAKIDKAVHGSPASTPFFLEVGAILKYVADNVVAPAAALVGNAPGPLTLMVAVSKLHLVWQLKTPATAVISAEKYLLWAAKLARVSAADVTMAVFAAGPMSPQAEIFFTRINAAETAAGQIHASARWMKTVAFFDVVVIVSTACSTVNDIKSKGWMSGAVGADVSNMGMAGASLVGAIFKVRVANLSVLLKLKQAGQIEATQLLSAVEKLEGMCKICGNIAGLFGFFAGAFQVWQGIHEPNDVDKWSEIGGGTGTMLLSLGQFLDILVARMGPQIGVRVVAFLADVVAEETAVAIGGSLVAVMAGAGAIISGIGILFILLAIAYKNKNAIMAFLEENATPGPAKACKAYLQALTSSRAYAQGPAAVRTAATAATAALTHAWFINFMPSDSVKAELKSIGMSDQDLGLVATLAPFSPDALAAAQL